MSTDPETYTITPRTPTDHEAEITATLEAFQARNSTPDEEAILRTVLECGPGGVLTLLELTDDDGQPIRILEMFLPGRKSRTIRLSGAALDALCARWQGKKEGGSSDGD